MVVTLPSLQDYDIADYGYQLGRHWGIGQKGTNNGAILIVAPSERQVRIEVGYGLEGMLTDAVTRLIITNAILPRFRTGDFAGGIERGVDDIIQVLSGDAEDFKRRAAEHSGRPSGGEGMSLFVFVIIILVVWFLIFRAQSSQQRVGRRSRSGPVFVPPSGAGGRQGADRAGDGPEEATGASPAAADRSAAADRPGAGEMPDATFTHADRARLTEAIRAAEAQRPGEIYVVVAREAGEFRFVPVLWAALAALVLPWPLHLLTSWPTTIILLLQVRRSWPSPSSRHIRRCATGWCRRASQRTLRARRRWRSSWRTACI